MSKLQNVLLRGTRAGQPAANTVAVGSLYYVTDEQITEQTDGANWLSYYDGYSFNITKSADQVVTNNATLQNDTELVFALGANEIWLIELLLIHSANDATGDFKYNFAFPSSSGFHRYVSSFDGANALALSTGIQLSAVTALAAAIVLGGDAGDTPRVNWHQIFIRTTAAANIQFQFANNAAAGGRTSTVRAGSILRGKQLV